MNLLYKGWGREMSVLISYCKREVHTWIISLPGSSPLLMH